MKKSELRKIIREEIRLIVEDAPNPRFPTGDDGYIYQLVDTHGFDKVLQFFQKRAGIPGGVDGKPQHVWQHRANRLKKYRNEFEKGANK